MAAAAMSLLYANGCLMKVLYAYSDAVNLKFPNELDILQSLNISLRSLALDNGAFVKLLFSLRTT